MVGLPARVSIGVASVAAFVLGYALPGSYALAAGMLAFLLLPLLVRLPIGVPTRTNDGLEIVTGQDAARRIDVTVRIMGALAWLAFAWAVSVGRDAMLFAVFGVLIGNGCGLLALFGLFGRVFSPTRGAHAVTLDRETLSIISADGSHVFRYGDVEKVDVDGNRIGISAGGERILIHVAGPPTVAAEIGRAILEAKARATRNRADDRPGVRELHRPRGMGTREWLGRIDALAAASRDPSAYRGGANIDEGELWTLFNDEAADADVRAAAARVLAAAPDEAVRVRVAAAAAGIADDGVRGRVRVALNGDAESAAAEMDWLEMEELRKGAGV